MLRYVVRIISTSSRSGKTEIGTRVASCLLGMGYDVGAIKHCSHGIELEVKDTSRYISSGVKLVVASSKDLLVIYKSQVIDDLGYVLRYVDKPLVIVEGFRDQVLGDSIGIVRSLEDLKELVRIVGRLDAIASDDEEAARVALDSGIAVFRLNDYEGMAGWIKERALSTIIGRLPGNNCGMCGFATCKSFAEAYLKGLAKTCPATSDVRLVVNDINVSLNPFVKRLISSIVDGLLNSLKEVPQRKRRVLIEVNY